MVAKRVKTKRFNLKKMDVHTNAQSLMEKNQTCAVSTYSWTQLNTVVESLWEKNNKLEYVGEVMDVRGNLCCVFQEMIRNSNNTYKKGKVYTVENDVVFKYQKDKKPIDVVRKYPDEITGGI